MAQKTKAEFDAMIAASRAQKAAFRAAIMAHGERPFEAKTQWGTVFVSKDPRTPAKPWRISFFGASRREGEKAHPEGHVELKSFLEAIDELPAYGVNNASQIRFEPPWSLNPMRNPFVHPGLPEEDLAVAKGEISTWIKLSKMSKSDRDLALRFLSSLVNTLREPRSEIAAMRSIEYDGVQIVSLVTAPGNVANGMEITAVLRRLARRAVQSGVIGHYPLGQFFEEPPDVQSSRAARAEVAKQATEAEKKRLLEELKEERRLRSLTAKRATTDKAAAKARAKLLEIDEPGMPVEHLGPIPVRGIETGEGVTPKGSWWVVSVSGTDKMRLEQHEGPPKGVRAGTTYATEEGAYRAARRMGLPIPYDPLLEDRTPLIETEDPLTAKWQVKRDLINEARLLIAQNNLGPAGPKIRIDERQAIYDAAAHASARANALGKSHPGRAVGRDSPVLMRKKADRLKEIADELGDLERPSKPWGSEKSEIASRMAQLELNPKRGNPANITYDLPEEKIGPVRPNPAEKFSEVFGVPPEAHLMPVWPKDARKKSLPIIKDAKQLAEYLSGMEGLPQEHYLVCMIDTRGRLIGITTTSMGTLNQAIVDMREVFAAAIAARAYAIIGVHNHPSGDATPSAADISLTERLEQASEILGIPLLDHIVIGQGGTFVSLAAMGLGKWAGRKRNPKPMPDWRKKACDDRCDVLVDMARKSGVIEKIERRFGVTLGRDYLDCGARACVWDLGDKVLKLTDDADDASTASYIKRFRDQLPEGDRDALAEVFEACMIEGRGGARRFWVVIAEKLDPLDDDEAQALSDLHKMSRMGFRDIMSPGTANAFPTPGGQKALLAWRALGRLYEQGVNVSKDAHNRNWGRDAKGRLKLFDFGASGVPSFGGSAPECVLKNPG